MQAVPADLGDAGNQLWKDMHAALSESEEFEERDLTLLALACRQMDDIVLLQAVLATDGPITTGSTGQPVLSSVVGELRNARQSVARLIKQIDFGNEKLSASQQARAAARARWGGRPSPINPHRKLPEAK